MMYPDKYRGSAVFEVLCSGAENTKLNDMELQGWSDDRIRSTIVCGREMMTLPELFFCVVKTHFSESRHTEELFFHKSFDNRYE